MPESLTDLEIVKLHNFWDRASCENAVLNPSLCVCMCVCIGGGIVPGHLHFSAPCRRCQCVVWTPSPHADDAETKGRERTDLEVEWEKEAMVPLGSGLLVAA